MKRLCALLLAIGLSVTLLIGAPLPAQENPQATTESRSVSPEALQSRYGGVYRAPLLNNPRTLDPAYVEDMYGVTVVQQLFDGLVRFSPDLYVLPALAENWRVEEGGTVYRFLLRQDARFHNGQRVSAKDVVFSLSRLIRVNPPPAILPHLLKIIGAQNYLEQKTDRIDGILIVDHHTVLMRLDHPYAPFLTALGMYQAKIVPQEEVLKNEAGFGREPVGSGPFKFVEWRQNEKIQLTAFRDYYGGPPYLDTIDYIVYPGINIEAVLADFENGKLHEMPVSKTILQKLKDRTDLQRVHRPSLSLQFYGFNCQHPLLKDAALRDLLFRAIDRQKLVSEAYGGQLELALSLIPPGLPGYLPNSEFTRADADGPAAVKIPEPLASKIKDSGPIEIVSNSQSVIAQAELKYVQEYWARLGITANIKYITDWAEFERYLKSDALQLYRYAWFADIPDPDNFLQPLFASNSQTNFMRFKNAEVDAMLQRSVSIMDPIERSTMYQQIQKKILASHPLIPLCYLSIDAIYQPFVKGIAVSALGTHSVAYNGVWIK